MSEIVCLLTWILVSLTLFKTVLSVLILPSFLDGVCDLSLCVCVFLIRAAVRAFGLACPADYCLL